MLSISFTSLPRARMRSGVGLSEGTLKLLRPQVWFTLILRRGSSVHKWWSMLISLSMAARTQWRLKANIGNKERSMWSRMAILSCTGSTWARVENERDCCLYDVLHKMRWVNFSNKKLITNNKFQLTSTNNSRMHLVPSSQLYEPLRTTLDKSIAQSPELELTKSRAYEQMGSTSRISRRMRSLSPQ